MIVKKDNSVVYIKYVPYRSYRLIIATQLFIIIGLLIKLTF